MHRPLKTSFFQISYTDMIEYRFATHICLRGRWVVVTGWPQSQDVTAARLELGQVQLGPTSEQVHSRRGSVKLGKFSVAWFDSA